MLRRNAKPRPEGVLTQLTDLVKQADQAASPAALLGFEGAAARAYFSALPAMLRNDHALPGGPFDFTGRNRRPAKDPINSLLSFTYSLLTKDLFAHALTVGFDPYLGFFHRPRFGRPALSPSTWPRSSGPSSPTRWSSD